MRFAITFHSLLLLNIYDKHLITESKVKEKNE